MLVGKLHVRWGSGTLCGRSLPHPGLTAIPLTDYRRMITEMCAKCEERIWVASMLERIAVEPKIGQTVFTFMDERIRV